MKIEPFLLERYFAQHEFTTPYLLCCSDVEGLALRELLAMADTESMALWESLHLGYTDSQGHPLLREEIACLYPGLTGEDILVLAPEEGIFIAMNVLLAWGDHVIATFPGYQSLYEVARAIGCEVTLWTPREEAGWSFDLDWLREQIRENTRLIVVNWPHNPTGALVSHEAFGELLEIVRERGIYLFSDEMYRFLEYEASARLPSASVEYEKAISLGGMSKAFALAGLRIGWLATRNRVLYQKMAAFKDYTTICCSAPSEILALMALRTKETILARNLSIIQRNLALLDGFFARHEAFFSWVRPKAGTIGFPRLLAPTPISRFCTDLLEEQRVLLMPADVYNFPGNYFRIGFGRTNMPEALARLEAYLEQ